MGENHSIERWSLLCKKHFSFLIQGEWSMSILWIELCLAVFASFVRKSEVYKKNLNKRASSRLRPWSMPLICFERILNKSWAKHASRYLEVLWETCRTSTSVQPPTLWSSCIKLELQNLWRLSKAFISFTAFYADSVRYYTYFKIKSCT